MTKVRYDQWKIIQRFAFAYAFALFFFRSVRRSCEEMPRDRDIIENKHSKVCGTDRRFTEEVMQSGNRESLS